MSLSNEESPRGLVKKRFKVSLDDLPEVEHRVVQLQPAG